MTEDAVEPETVAVALSAFTRFPLGLPHLLHEWRRQSMKQETDRVAYDVYISYSHQDSPWVQGWLARRLISAGLSVWLDDSIRPGSVWKEEIEKALRLLSSLPQQQQTVVQLAVDRATNDHEAKVRSSAIELLPQVWVGNPRSLSQTLSDWVRTSSNVDVRHVALLTLCETYKNAQVVLGLLLDRAGHDDDPIVRTVAVERLVDGWSADARIYQFLCDRAKLDTDPDVRRAANKVALPRVRVFFS